MIVMWVLKMEIKDCIEFQPKDKEVRLEVAPKLVRILALHTYIIFLIPRGIDWSHFCYFIWNGNPIMTTHYSLLLARSFRCFRWKVATSYFHHYSSNLLSIYFFKLFTYLLSWYPMFLFFFFFNLLSRLTNPPNIKIVQKLITI